MWSYMRLRGEYCCVPGGENERDGCQVLDPECGGDLGGEGGETSEGAAIISGLACSCTQESGEGSSASLDFNGSEAMLQPRSLVSMSYLSSPLMSTF